MNLPLYPHLRRLLASSKLDWSIMMRSSISTIRAVEFIFHCLARTVLLSNLAHDVIADGGLLRQENAAHAEMKEIDNAWESLRNARITRSVSASIRGKQTVDSVVLLGSA